MVLFLLTTNVRVGAFEQFGHCFRFTTSEQFGHLRSKIRQKNNVKDGNFSAGIAFALFLKSIFLHLSRFRTIFSICKELTIEQNTDLFAKITFTLHYQRHYLWRNYFTSQGALPILPCFLFVYWVIFQK